MGHRVTESNAQVRATTTIWGCAVGMLGVCIPLVAITESGAFLPLLVILSAAGGTFAVWRSSSQRKEIETRSLKALEERVMNLETIYTSMPDTVKSFSLSESEGR